MLHVERWLRRCWILAAMLAGCSKHEPPAPVTAKAEALAPSAASAAVPASATPVASAAPPVPEGPPKDLNVLLITIDSLRADMPWAGYQRPIAPRLTELEKHAVSYTNAYALSSYTSMSVGGLLGGRLPGEMKRDGYFFGSYPKDNFMFPEALQAAGIRTVAVQGHGYFRKGYAGFDQGFDEYELVPDLKWNATTDENVTGPKMEAMAEAQLSKPENVSGRFFAWYHFLDPHDQYMQHAEVEPWGKKGRDRYDGEVTFTDMQIAKLLEFVEKQPWGARTAIIVSADHGEAFGEHGLYRHGFEIVQPLVHVPLMFVVPGAAPKRIAENRSALDLAPTILELFGLPPEPRFTGKSLVPELYGEVEPEARDVIVDLPRTSHNDRRRAIIRGHYKVIAYGDDKRFEVFDLDADPGEERSIEKTDRAKFDEMVALYKTTSATIQDVNPYACRKLKGAPEGRAY